MPAATPVDRSDLIRPARLARIDEVLTWRIGAAKPDTLFGDMGLIAAKLARGEEAELCSRSVIALLEEPGSGPFWMFPSTCVAYLGRGQLSAEAQAAIRRGWRTTMQLRGDTENHWAMYYASLYLMAQLYPNEAADTWYSGKTSTENFNEARDYLIHWMDLATTVGQGEFNPTHYIGEYAIPMMFLAAWAQDPEMRIRGRMKLDWLLADLAEELGRGVAIEDGQRHRAAGAVHHITVAGCHERSVPDDDVGREDDVGVAISNGCRNVQAGDGQRW